MDISEKIKIISIIIVAVGCIVSYLLSRKKDQELESRKIKLQHLNAQISEFYGPIYSILLENDRIRQLIQDQIGRNIIFDGNNELNDEEKKIWIHYLENYLIPNNRKIIDILENKIHLNQGYTFPNIYREWIDHALGYEVFHSQYKDFGFEYGFHSISNFPTEFRTEIINTMSQLKKKQFEIVGLDLPSPYKEKTEHQFAQER